MIKKFVFIIMPLMAVSFLTNCNKEPAIVKCTLDITFVNCTINDGESKYFHTYNKGETIETIKVTPTDDSHFLIKNSIPEAYQQYWSESEGSYVLSNLVMNDNYKFTIEAFAEYTANADKDKSEYLDFLTVNDESLENIKIYEGQNFSFKIKVSNISNEYVTYTVPSVLDITIEGAGKLIEGYDIYPNKDLSEADVVINGSKIIGNVTISGSAIVAGQYRYEVAANYGLEDIESDTHDAASDLSIRFTPTSKDESNENYEYPHAENIYIQFDNCPVSDRKQWVSPAETFATVGQYCTYNETDGTLTIKSRFIRSNIIIVARAYDYPLLDKSNWNQIQQVSFSGLAEYVFYLGEEKTVTINNKPHKVHIIGFKEDYTKLPIGGGDPDPSKAIGITFEFENVISDENGFSLATYWKDAGIDARLSSSDYKNSSVRKALIGEGGADLNWFRYYGSEEDTEGTGKNRHFVPSDDPYYQKSVYEMLPEELTSVLATPSKYINIWNDEKQSGAGWEEQTIEDKLFLLSPVELGKETHSDEEEHTTTYAYYKDGASRIKHQVSGADGARTQALKGDDLSGSYFVAKSSFAGCDYDGANGTCMWLRSPRVDNNRQFVFSVNSEGVMSSSSLYPYRDAMNIAPAFCV